MPYLIKAKNISDAWEKLVSLVMEKGHKIKDERGQITKELLNILTIVKYPIKNYPFPISTNKEILLSIPKDYYWRGDKLSKYTDQFLKKDKKGFVYTYGNRLRDHFSVDQIKAIIKRLKKCKKSRRATAVTWDPKIDFKNEEVPCMISIDFKIRNNKLHTTGIWRSHDIYQAWLPNAAALAILAKYISDKLNIKVGPLAIHSISAHIYEYCFDDAEKVRKNGKR